MKNNFSAIRITGGDLRGAEINSLETKATHPMGSRERLALMNLIGPDIAGATLLDAFAGTGAIGVEALSRGAAFVVFVEKDHKAVMNLQKNLQKYNLSNRAKIVAEPVEKFNSAEKFDFVVADPPYDLINKLSPNIFTNLSKLATQKFLLSHPANFDPHVVDAELQSTRSYAAARISIFH
jgi:16S rRNA (guanine(966)-N(2))-methyltransferase RsmD